MAGESRTSRTAGRVYAPYNQGLAFSQVAQGSSTQGVDSVTTASSLQFWQGNDNTVNQNNRAWPLQKALGRDVYRFETRPGDQGYSGDNPLSVSRSLLVGSNHPMSFGVNWDFAFGFMVEPGFSFNASVSFIALMQFYHTPDGADTNTLPPFFIQVNPFGANLLFTITMRTSNANALTVDPGAKVLFQTPVYREQRYQIYGRTKWAPAGSGIHSVHLGVEGQAAQQVVNYTGATGYNDAVAPYMDVGCYNANTGDVNVAVQIANPELSTSDLSGRIASPLAW
jgi:hypothetical protein